MPAVADAVAREAAWFAADLSAQGIPALLKVGAGDGPFEAVAAYARRISQRSHQLYVWREGVTDRRLGAGTHVIEHFFVATILWSQISTAAKANIDQASLDAALDRVFARIRGGADRTHGGRFTAVGSAAEGPGIAATYLDPFDALRPADAPGGAGAAYVVEVRFVATETIAAP